MNCINVKCLIIVLCFAGVSSSTDGNCKWIYKCCEFKQINDEVKCVKMCEPEIKCEAQPNSDYDVETFSADNVQGQSEAFSMKSGACRRGFQLSSGRCRRIIRQMRK